VGAASLGCRRLTGQPPAHDDAGFDPPVSLRPDAAARLTAIVDSSDGAILDCRALHSIATADLLVGTR
jgi:hypothetical protein